MCWMRIEKSRHERVVRVEVLVNVEDEVGRGAVWVGDCPERRTRAVRHKGFS